nr:hypothetical protein [Tanacetum cinerariifolium]GEZ90102.1 hypothetical protein [Tanacetum cinerariifolium]
MEEYIQLLAEKAQRRRRMFNWEITTYDFEAYYPSIVYNDALTSNENVPIKPPVSIYN